VNPRPWYELDAEALDRECRAMRFRIRRAKSEQNDSPFGLLLIPLICVALAMLA
jgi:hypothetical protein